MASERALTDRAAGSGPAVSEASADELTLVAAVLRRDRKATAEFISTYADPVYGYVRQRLAPRADLVEDLVQDVFLSALQSLPTFAGRSSLASWLLGIARHKVEDFYRARLREPEPVADHEDRLEAGAMVFPAFDEGIDHARIQDKAQRVLERLPETYGLALLWRYWEMRSTKEMATKTGKTEKAIERLLARARAHFRRLWEADRP